MTRLRALLAVAALLIAASGCAKARAFPNGNGGYTLLTSADNLEQALVRFDRTARDKCGAGRGEFAKPEIVDREWHGSVWHGGETTLTVQTTLTCH